MPIITPAMTSNTAPSPWVVSATATSIVGDEYRAYDQTQNVWSFSIGGNPLPQSSQVFTGGGLVDVHRVRFKTRLFLRSYPRDFEIFYSDNGSVWTSAGSFFQADTLAGDTYSSWFTVSGVPSKYWRFEISTSNGVSDIHDLAAIEFSGPFTVELSEIEIDRTLDSLGLLRSLALGDITVDRDLDGLGLIIGAPLSELPVISATETLLDSSFYINPSTDIPSTTIYRLTLTGAQDAVSDLELPISNAQSRLRVGVNFLSATVPNVQAFSTDIGLRPNGQLVLSRGARFFDGSEQLVEIARVDYDRLEVSQGSVNVSGTIQGNLTTTESTGKTINLVSGSFFSSGTGSRRYTTTPDYNIKPGDTVVVPETSETYVAGSISIQVAAAVELMTVTEVE